MSPASLRSSIDPDDLEPRLRSVIRWVSARLSGALEHERLRTRDLLPTSRSLRDNEAVANALAVDPWGLVEAIAVGRRLPMSLSTRELPGRLMVYFPHQNLCDGAAETVSEGFFDVDNAPPWDTWVACFHDRTKPELGPYVIAWIPEPFIAFADAGIGVNPEECIAWLDESGVEAKRLFTRLYH
ncbi:hypothetical protein ACNOYE_32160 [Nannocystaceae bacterium ST9]